MGYKSVCKECRKSLNRPLKHILTDFILAQNVVNQ